MSIEPPQEPVPAVAVSPDDHTSDRAQSDADQAVNVDRGTDDRAQSDTDQALNTGKLDELVQASRELSDNARALTETSNAEIIAAHRQRRRFAITLVAIAVVLAVVLVGIYVSLQSSHQRGNSNSQLLKVIQGCVQPTGKCFKDGQARTSNVVDLVTQASLNDAALAAACAPDYVDLPIQQRIDAIHACILRNLPEK